MFVAAALATALMQEVDCSREQGYRLFPVVANHLETQLETPTNLAYRTYLEGRDLSVPMPPESRVESLRHECGWQAAGPIMQSVDGEYVQVDTYVVVYVMVGNDYGVRAVWVGDRALHDPNQSRPSR